MVVSPVKPTAEKLRSDSGSAMSGKKGKDVVGGEQNGWRSRGAGRRKEVT